MSVPISLTIQHRNTDYEVLAQIEPRGYTYRVLIEVQNAPVYFEPDEEGNFRAIVESRYHQDSMDKELLQKIADLLKDALA